MLIQMEKPRYINLIQFDQPICRKSRGFGISVFES